MTSVADTAPPAERPAAPVRPPIGRSTRAVAVSVAVVAVAGDLAIRSVAGGVAATVAVAVLALGLATFGWVVRPGGRVLLVVAAGLSTAFTLRASPWLIALDAVAIAVVLALACTAEQGARAFDTRFGTTGRRLGAAFVDVAGAAPDTVRLAGALLPSSSGPVRRSLGAVVRGLLVAVPLVAVIGILLAAADPVFASMFDVGVDLDGLPPHVLLVVLGAWVATGWFVQATRPPIHRSGRTPPIGPVEGIVVTGALTAVYAVFAWTQLLVAQRGPDYVVETTGLTYAEYARSGFFQLLWVAGLTAVALVAVRSLVRPGARWSRTVLAGLGAVAATLTLVVVRAAIVRLDLYEAAFGLTVLRFWSSVVAWWLGAVFVLLGAASLSRAIDRPGPRREWLPMAIGLSALVALVVVNVADPDRTVARHDLERADRGLELDAAYLATLSDDAVPTLVAATAGLPAEDARALTVALCARDHRSGPSWNRADRAADRALDDLCG